MQWRSYFTFSKNERIGLMVFLGLMGIFLSAPYWVDQLVSHKQNQAAIEFQLRQMEKDSTTSFDEAKLQHSSAMEEHTISNPVLQPFNPNTMQEKDWIAMGIPEKTARTLQRYTDKGGRFRKASDLYKIWGMRASDVLRLAPYVRIEAASTGFDHEGSAYSHAFNATAQPIRIIDINTADSASWESLPGIGPVLAGRIIRYRTRRGGFQSVDNIKAVYGLPDSVFTKIQPFLRVYPTSMPPTKKYDINKLSVTELQKIGMLSRDVAQAIVLYRQQYGAFQQIADLRKLVLITDSLMRNIEQTMEVSRGN